MAFVLLTLAIVAATAYVVGVLLLGNGDIGQTTTVSGTALSQQQLIGRTFLALGYALLCMLGVAAIALFLSTVVDSPLGAAMGTMAVLVASTLLLTPRRGGLDRGVPAHALLAGLRRPVPRPDPLARRRPWLAAAGRVRAGVPRCRLGQLRDEGHQGLTRASRSPGPVRRAPPRPARGSRRRSPQGCGAGRRG
jgi:hypothetical protein